jgi:hypothetical protein
MFNFPESCIIATTLAPAADAAGRNGTAVSVKQAIRLWVVYYLDQGNAATALLAPEQCSAVAGTGNKAIPVSQIFANQDMVASSVLVKQTAAANFTTSAAVKRKVVIFSIDPAALDVANGFDCVRAVTGASNAANITSALVIMQSRYQGQTTADAMAD